MQNNSQVPIPPTEPFTTRSDLLGVHSHHAKAARTKGGDAARRFCEVPALIAEGSRRLLQPTAKPLEL